MMCMLCPLLLLVWVPFMYLYDHGTGWISAPMVQLPLGNVKLLNVKIELRLHEVFTLPECEQVLHWSTVLNHSSHQQSPLKMTELMY